MRRKLDLIAGSLAGVNAFPTKLDIQDIAAIYLSIIYLCANFTSTNILFRVLLSRNLIDERTT